MQRWLFLPVFGVLHFLCVSSKIDKILNNALYYRLSMWPMKTNRSVWSTWRNIVPGSTYGHLSQTSVGSTLHQLKALCLLQYCWRRLAVIGDNFLYFSDWLKNWTELILCWFFFVNPCINSKIRSEKEYFDMKINVALKKS